MVTESLKRLHENFVTELVGLKQAASFSRPARIQKIINIVDLLSRSSKGLELLLEKSLDLEAAGIFADSAWEDPNMQVPTLVKGTLMAGHPTSSMEILSELRILAYALGKKGVSTISTSDAIAFLEEVVVHNLEFAFDELTEENRSRLTQQERRKVVSHFKFLLFKVNLPGIKEKLAEEIAMVCAQRPIVTHSVRNLIQTIYQKMDLEESDPVNERLQYYVNAIYFPGPIVVRHPNYERYQKALTKAKTARLEEEAKEMGNYLKETGLTNPYLAIMLRFAVKKAPELVPLLLTLSPEGTSEWEKHQYFIRSLVLDTFNEENFRGIYGLKRMLERSLFSRRPVRAGLTNLKLINIHPKVERRILKSMAEPGDLVTAKQVLMAALISILGQPIGIGQGNNATCQSARGISLWAQHAPAKLINMVTTVTTANNLIMRFENQDLESTTLGKGLVDKLDYQLDAVSVILVPHLDKIYNKMMQLAAGRGEDPHKWANPALYGQWISTGFASAYSYLTHSIQDFQGFVRLFYASFHPKYNGGRMMVYPNPVGIFITTSKGAMLGFHALSLLRVAPNPNKDGEIRAYFLNPNNEGRQNWGQGIKPTVYGAGERHGESSLPIHEFVARLYAFHYNNLNVDKYLERVPSSELLAVEELARNSWGRNYQWINLEKQW